MATIWFLKEGEPQVGPSMGQKQLDWCEKNLGLRADNWIADLATRNLVIGEKNKAGLGPYRNFRFVVIQVDEDDLTPGATKDWKPGFYLLDDMDATEVRKVLKR